MKPKLLFLAKFFGISLALFVFGRQLLHMYASLLVQWMATGYPIYRPPPNLEEFLYGSSMTIIAFVALILSTPNMLTSKKAMFLFAGTVAFFLTDLVFVKYVIFPYRRVPLNEDSPVYEMYFCIKWLLPFLLWIIASYPIWGDLLHSPQEAKSKA
jgi:hypothetical protein